MEFISTTTSDQLVLNGFHYPPKNNKKKLCMLFFHGMEGFFIENEFADDIGKSISKDNIGFVYSHNRGYAHINDIRTTKINPKDNSFGSRRVGAFYELFEESPMDIEAWIQETINLGYENIVLAGHSLGATKLISYLQHKSHSQIKGVILLSPADMVGLTMKELNYKKLLDESQDLIRKNKPTHLLSDQLWNWAPISAQTFQSIFSENSPGDIFPLHDPSNDLSILQSIKWPLLILVGQHDDIAIDSLEKDISRIKKAATNSPKVDTVFLEGANHCYNNRELELTRKIKDWITSL